MKFYGQSGHFTYDPGFTSTASCESKITYIDGDAGVLLYRGYPIDQIADQSSFLETAFLLLTGELPTGSFSANGGKRWGVMYKVSLPVLLLAPSKWQGCSQLPASPFGKAMGSPRPRQGW